jgi:4-alpha-glucanotransferase
MTTTPSTPSTTHAKAAFPRAAGILLHPTSLPSRHGIGDVGAGARAFVEWLTQAGCTHWQILPLVPPGAGFSPYASQSSLAGNALLIDLDDLVERGALLPEEVAPPRAFHPDRVEWADVVAWKRSRIERACERLNQTAAGRALREAFVAAHPWVLEDALFVAIKAAEQDRAWWQWPAPLTNREPAALAEARVALRGAIERRILEQALFDAQWHALAAYARTRGIRFIGDIPIYVADDSVDVWANRRFFQLDAAGRPTHVAGCPPDAFSETGQWWGSPLYRWDALAADGHAWWVQRLRRNLELTDVVRIDHFRGFAGYWSIPADAKDARAGQWVTGPGQALFADLQRALGASLPIIAEDLGVITPDVVALREAVGLPGMKILQFAFGAGHDHPYLPHHHVDNGVVYTGTHDNNTTLGWWQAESEATKRHVRRYLDRDEQVSGHDVVWGMIRQAMLSVAHTAIVPLQDILALDGGARMNLPGEADGHWSWRVRIEAFHESLSDRLRSLVELGDRLPPSTDPRVIAAPARGA